ncbi:hypothetical protein IFM89_022859 [Coptis chinensis]|uniref:NmrA-like domain-containing protein n=1 Tax=Coptis chinensis TaxID=261450 RepID=A0A835HJA1_9MAGN|nr:hypothetical protein IFM89_022859 [Coptis chinensis]
MDDGYHRITIFSGYPKSQNSGGYPPNERETESCREGAEKTVCVTGASGYIASWLVKLLIERGYTVKASVRDPNDPRKTENLCRLPRANERLHLFSANLMEEGSFDSIVAGCEGVFHTASPCYVDATDPQDFGYPPISIAEILFNTPGVELENGLRTLMTDSDVSSMVKEADIFGNIEVYVVHKQSNDDSASQSEIGSINNVSDEELLEIRYMRVEMKKCKQNIDENGEGASQTAADDINGEGTRLLLMWFFLMKYFLKKQSTLGMTVSMGKMEITTQQRVMKKMKQ